MPDGIVQWFDAATGEGRILRGSRRYAVEASSMEAAARVPGARVYFDIDDRTPADTAINVTVRAGRRTSPSQRRFGDLTGARAPDTKGTAPFARAQPDEPRDLQGHPLRVAEAWSHRLASGELDQAMLYYAPVAALYVDGGHASGPVTDPSPLVQLPPARRSTTELDPR